MAAMTRAALHFATAAALAFGGVGAVSASCTCTCINGSVQAVCTSTMDLPPLCAPRICPLTPPSLQPLSPPTLPPLGTQSCEMKQVWNPRTNQYEWKQVCR